MPELPEVETIVQDLLKAELIGTSFVKIEVFWDRIAMDPKSLFKKILRQPILNIFRRGKYIVFQFPGIYLIAHLRMTGKIHLKRDGNDPMPGEHLRIYLSDGQVIRYQDHRKFGRWMVIEDLEAYFKGKLGIEPLSNAFTLQAFKAILSGKKIKIKSFLLDQRFISGLGNIYVDEALWEAKIHPLRTIDTLNMREIQQLHSAIQNVLKKGILNRGTSLGLHSVNYAGAKGIRGENQNTLNVFRQQGKSCPRCGSKIVKISASQRGTHLCPACQRY